MSDQTEGSSRRERTWTYWVAGGFLVLLVVITLFTFGAANSNRQAKDKADQFIAALDKAGAATPSQDQVVRVLGEDGGAVCADPGAALSKATLQGMLYNGAAEVGMRPVIADNKALAGQLLVVKIYCPDALPKVQDFVDKLKTDSVVKE